MKCMKRNKRKFYYCQYESTMQALDSNGNQTGEDISIYSAPVAENANISPATGSAQTEMFGNLENYDKVIVLDDINCPINENSVLFIDKDPEMKATQTYKWIEVEVNNTTTETLVSVSIDIPIPDYLVRRVAKSINSVSIAVSKVTVR